MFKRKPKVLTPAQVKEIRTKDFFDCILPSTIKFMSDHYILGDSYEKAMAYLHASADHGNVYAQQLLHSIHSGRNWSAAMGSLRLLQHISRIIQNRLEDERKGRIQAIDHKLKRKIDEKKQAHGLKQ